MPHPRGKKKKYRGGGHSTLSLSLSQVGGGGGGGGRGGEEAERGIPAKLMSCGRRRVEEGKRRKGKNDFQQLLVSTQSLARSKVLQREGKYVHHSCTTFSKKKKERRLLLPLTFPLTVLPERPLYTLQYTHAHTCTLHMYSSTVNSRYLYVQ